MDKHDAPKPWENYSKKRWKHTGCWLSPRCERMSCVLEADVLWTRFYGSSEILLWGRLPIGRSCASVCYRWWHCGILYIFRVDPHLKKHSVDERPHIYLYIFKISLVAWIWVIDLFGIYFADLRSIKTRIYIFESERLSLAQWYVQQMLSSKWLGK